MNGYLSSQTIYSKFLTKNLLTKKNLPEVESYRIDSSFILNFGIDLFSNVITSV